MLATEAGESLYLQGKLAEFSKYFGTAPLKMPPDTAKEVLSLASQIAACQHTKSLPGPLGNMVKGQAILMMGEKVGILNMLCGVREMAKLALASADSGEKCAHIQRLIESVQQCIDVVEPIIHEIRKLDGEED